MRLPGTGPVAVTVPELLGYEGRLLVVDPEGVYRPGVELALKRDLVPHRTGR